MKLFKYFLIALLVVGCTNDNDIPDSERDLSGVYEGTITITQIDYRPETAGKRTSPIFKQVNVAKFNSQYVVTNYGPQLILNDEGFGTQTIDDRLEFPYGVARDEKDWYNITINTISIHRTSLTVKDHHQEYNFENVLMTETIFEGTIEKR